jgi:hypothetical protein
MKQKLFILSYTTFTIPVFEHVNGLKKLTQGYFERPGNGSGGLGPGPELQQ